MNNKYHPLFSSPHFASFILIPFLQCQGLEEFSERFKFYGILWYIVYLVALYLVFKSEKKHWNTYIIMAVFVLMQCSTIINNSYSGGMLRSIGCVSFFIIVDYYLRYNPMIFLKGIINLSVLIMLLQFISLLIYFKGFNFEDSLDFGDGDNSFFAAKNFAPYYYVAMMCVACYFRILQPNAMSKRCLILIVLCILCGFLQWSGTGVTGICMYGILLLLYYNLKFIKSVLAKFTDYRILSCMIIFVTFTLLVSQNVDFFSTFVEDVLHKDMTFSGRTELWALGLLNIIQQPLIGIGSNEAGRITVLENDFTGVELSSHNMFIEIATQGGVFALILFVCWYFYSLKEVKYPEKDSQIIIHGAIFVLFLMYMFEGLPFQVFPFLVFSLGYYTKYHYTRILN